MTPAAIVMMVVGMLAIWGGLLTSVLLAVRRSRARQADEPPRRRR